jgi:AraC-like DNA-binding protein
MLETVVNGKIDYAFRDRKDAHELYQDFVCDNFCKLTGTLDRDSLFEVHGRTYAIDEFMVGRFATVAGRGHFSRTREGTDEAPRGRFALYMPVKGEQELSQFSRAETLKPGCFSLVSLDEPFQQRKSGDNDTLYLLLPYGFVDQRLLRGDDLCVRQVAADDGIRRLTYDSILTLQKNAGRMTALELDCAIRMVGELALVALDSSVDIGANLPSVRAANYARARRIIRARLENSDLRIEDVARECGISLRYLHELFSSDGNTVSQYLKQQRLQRARYLLDRASELTTVTDISLSCGFSNVSQFSTAFRQAFSIPPRDVMRRAIAGAASRYAVSAEPQSI